MGLLDKLKTSPERGPGVATASAPAVNTRASNGLKDFLWILGDVERGQVLDLGTVSQSTVSFFTNRGFKVYTEDLLHSWRGFLKERELRLRSAQPGEAQANDPASLAEEFLAANLVFADEQFNAVLAWDVFDYLDAELLPRVVTRLYGFLKPGGVLLGIFHTRAPEQFWHYRVFDPQTIEMVPAATRVQPQRFLQNRDILNLFTAFRSSKTYVSRDQNREGLFTK